MIRKSSFWASGVMAAMSAGTAVAQSAASSDHDQVVVVGQREDLLHIPGSGATIEKEDLRRTRVLSVNEALRQVAGVFPREEEGLGLRPNIGLRGLSPIRSSKVLLLEDGLPVTYGPYGDNASYSHPPIRRFERIEVLKGASQVRFGPNTVGGVVNYITPDAPTEFEAELQATGGANGYAELDASMGGEVAGFRLLGHVNSTGFDGVRANHRLEFNDIFLKVERTLAPGHELTARVGLMRENSQVSYSGLTQAEYLADPYSNPFPNDRFDTERFTAALTHAWSISDTLQFTSAAYSLWFDRDWWRQSSNSSQRPNDSSDPLCGGMANLNTTCGTEGRLREYNQYGYQARLSWDSEWFGAPTNLETGVRWHTERQNRLQLNADTPDGRTPGATVNGGIPERQRRYAEAWSGFVTGEVEFGRFALSPGVRVESIEYERVNLATGAIGKTDLTVAIPGLGATFDLNNALVVYTGVHRGFAPPRTEDVVTSSGGIVDLDAEESINWELGLRGTPTRGIDIDVAMFRMDFENQIVPASVAGGVGATLTSAGETLHAGVEASLRGSLQDLGLMDANDVYFRTALTWVAEAEFVGTRFSGISGFGGISVTGNRLSYAPEWLASAAVGYAHADWLTLQAEVQHTGEMFTDDLNTVTPTPNGQRGLIDNATIWNFTANLTPGGGNVTLFVALKNAFDELYVVDRARGVLPGAPRLWQAGVSLSY